MRGQAENLIKLHKTQLKSDRTSCSAACANQMRLILHTAAYWLLWEVRQAIPESTPLKCTEFTTLQNRIIKIGPVLSKPLHVSASPSHPPIQIKTTLYTDTRRTDNDACRQSSSTIAITPRNAPSPETETCKLKRRKARATNPFASANVKPFPRTKTSAPKHPVNNPG